uniref:Uncharacterized protein n=1 Tax=Anopheles coluzzii TaxID=1518534 RepID=A0A8W7PBE9_ANOCL
MNARGMFSNPSVTVSRTFSFPSWIQRRFWCTPSNHRSVHRCTLNPSCISCFHTKSLCGSVTRAGSRPLYWEIVPHTAMRPKRPHLPLDRLGRAATDILRHRFLHQLEVVERRLIDERLRWYTYEPFRMSWWMATVQGNSLNPTGPATA